MYKRVWAVSLSLLFICAGFVRAQEFSREKAMEHVRYLAETVGPRPMGSLQEKAALEYAAVLLSQYGCRVEWQPVTQSNSQNTDSANVIGLFPGRSERAILIGAHIDSSGPEIPGANDDGSGVAVLLELARVLCQEKHESTLIFVPFCGEESGLVGSHHFAETYPLDNIALMLQLDMCDADGPLMIWTDIPDKQTPRWLVKASIDAYHELGYRNIDYPTHFQSLNNAFGGAGSDHQPFMEKGISAIAFVSDIRAPIHIRNDDVAHFKPGGLDRSGRLVLELVKQFDREQPPTIEDHYMLWLIGERPVFISPALLVVFLLISMFAALVVLVVLARKRRNLTEDKSIRLTWPKLAVLLLLIVVTAVASLWTAQLVKGQRIPWHAHPGAQVAFVIPFALLGIWLALQVTRKWKLRKNPYFYMIRSSIYFIVLISALWLLSGPRLALYPAAGLLLISLACLVPWGWLKGLLWILSPIMMFRLVMLPQYYEFAFRSLPNMFESLNTALMSAIPFAALILISFVWMMPFLLGFGAVYRSARGDLYGLKRFRHPAVSLVVLALIIGGSAWIASMPSYDSTWEQVVHVTQESDIEDKTSIIFSSGDYLKGVSADIAGRREVPGERESRYVFDEALDMDWLHDDISVEVENAGLEKLVHIKTALVFEEQPFTVSLRLDSEAEISVEDCSVHHVLRRKGQRVNLSWYSFPARTLKPELTLRMPADAGLKAVVRATFCETPLDIACSGENMHFIHRARILHEHPLLP